MKRIYDFSRKPARRNYTVADLQALKGSGTVLSMANPANNEELEACVEAGIDLFVVGGNLFAVNSNGFAEILFGLHADE